VWLSTVDPHKGGSISLMPKIVLAVLGMVAELETDIRKERQMAGLRATQAKGIHFGRQKRLTPVPVHELCHARAQGVKIRDLMVQYGLKKAAIYRYLAQGRLGDTQAEAAD
jgi:DNA invertase Pin-like site-specific DNA recombinase